MTSLTSRASAPDGLAALRTWPGRILVATLLVALGDLLFWGRAPGVSLPLFILVTGLAAALTNPASARPSRRFLAGCLLLAGCLPATEAFGLLPVLFCVGGLALAALLWTSQGSSAWLAHPWDVLRLLTASPFRLLGDAFDFVRAQAEQGRAARFLSAKHLVGWVVPLGLLAVFGVLLADANPVLERWLVRADPATFLYRVEPARMLVWAVLLVFCWPFLQVRLAAWTGWPPALIPPAPQTAPAAEPAEPWLDALFSRAAITRSLVLFNLLFGVQTVMDVAFLSGGVSLPEGLTYAGYAHRGAYPLIATALLAAAFVLIAMRPGGPAEGSGLLRALVYLFCAQNIGLVLSSIIRLDLYVSVYSLTYWRVAAFIWMGLCLAGLVLIAIRIRLGQSNRWLIGANLVVLVATLYGCCFVNFAALIADHNLQPGRERFDTSYLRSLGPDAIPAIDRALPNHPARRAELTCLRDYLATAFAAESMDWRSLTLRKLRLARSLGAAPRELASTSPQIETPPAGR